MCFEDEFWSSLARDKILEEEKYRPLLLWRRDILTCVEIYDKVFLSFHLRGRFRSYNYRFDLAAFDRRVHDAIECVTRAGRKIVPKAGLVQGPRRSGFVELSPEQAIHFAE